MPARDRFSYTFDNVANVMTRFTEAIGLDPFALYIFDYGAPVGLRMALKHPDRIAAIVSQNGNAYLEGLSDGWNPIRAYWKDPSQANRNALRTFLKPETTEWQYTQGAPDKSLVSPDGYSLDNFYLARPGADEVQLDLMLDYASNVAMYPRVSAILPSRSTAAPRHLGPQRSILFGARGRGVQARHSERPGSLLGCRAFRN